MPLMPTPDAIASWLLAVSWQLLPLTAIVIILDLALRRAGPVVRSALWWMVLAKLLVPPGIASPLSIAQLLPVDRVIAAITDNAAAGTSDARARDASAVIASVSATEVAADSERGGTASSPLSMTPATAPEARSGWTDLGLTNVGLTKLALPTNVGLLRKFNRAPGAAMLLAIWAMGAIAAAALACWRYHRLRAVCLEGAVLLTDTAPEARSSWKDRVLPRTFNRASGAAILLATWPAGRKDGEDLGLALEPNRASGAATLPANLAAGAIAAASRQLGMTAPPPIFVAASDARVAGLPAVIGFFAPCIVLPRPLLERPSVEIEHVLLHELAHVRRGDPLTSLICLVAQIVFWFHPAIWCARHRLATLREMACDRTVARVLGDATPAYRRTLILLARSAALATAAPAPAAATASSRFAGGPGALGLFQRQSQLVTRLDALARPVSMRRATERAAGAAIALAILVSCVPLASSRGAPTASIDVPPLDRLSGSLQKRYAVMRALALEEQARAQSQPPR